VTGGRVERRLAAVLAADVAGYSRLMGAVEVGTARILREHRSEAHSVNDIMMMYEVCSQHQIAFVRRDCARLFKHAERLIDVWSSRDESTR
jgi:hypothetical protein